MPLDYETLRVIWWGLLGVLLIGFAIMDGFDLGAAMWLPWLARTDMDRRIIINTVAPTWEGNQVWLILGGGAIFAAWPTLYALSFSGFYLAMLVVLLALILRPVAFKYRSKNESIVWRRFWDWALFLSGVIPALIFGVAVGNVIQGVPFYFDETMRLFYTGSFWALLNPFAVLCGLLSVSMLAMHGAYFIQIKTEGTIQSSARSAGVRTALLTTLLYIIGGVWLYWGIDGYQVTTTVLHDAPSNPLHKSVIQGAGLWFNNYMAMPVSIILPVMGLVSPLLSCCFKNFAKTSFLLSSCSLIGIIGSVGVSMFPFILPSSSYPQFSLLVWDSSSSQLTLFIMFIATVIFMPLILLYTGWVYRVLRGKITENEILSNKHTSY